MRAAGLGGSDTEAYIRILITRGVGDLSYDPAACPDAVDRRHRQAARRAAGDVVNRGVKVALVSIVRNHPGTVNPLIKSNNLLNNALAMQEAVRQGRVRRRHAQLPRRARRVHTANLFIVKHGAALTPPLDAGLLAGHHA